MLREQSNPWKAGPSVLQICQALADNTTQFHWLEDSSVPILVRGSEFVAFDNEKSAMIKVGGSLRREVCEPMYVPQRFSAYLCGLVGHLTRGEGWSSFLLQASRWSRNGKICITSLWQKAEGKGIRKG